MPSPNINPLAFRILRGDVMEARTREPELALRVAVLISQDFPTDTVTVLGVSRVIVATFKGGQRIE